MFFPLILIGTSNGILVALKKHTARLKKENADFGVHHYVLLTYCLSVDSIWPWQKKGGGCTLSITRCKTIRRKFALTKVIFFLQLLFKVVCLKTAVFSLFCMFSCLTQLIGLKVFRVEASFCFNISWRLLL